MSIRSVARILTAGALTAGMLFSTPALAWDPSTTHAAMTREAVLSSQMHVRWMEQSGLTRGVFTAVRLHPSDLDDATARALRVAMRRVHEASGGAPLGGPGACPGPSAPASTQARCVDGDVWEMTALGWLQLGVVLETAPRNRLLHHFADGADAASPTWSDPELPASVLRSKARRAEGALARAANRSSFAGGATSAVAWLSDRSDPWAPPAALAHLRASETANDARERDRELVLGLVGLGALLHVVQDQSVPAHARGDLTAFFAPLSPTPGDRGLPLQELVRVLYGRNSVPSPVELSPRGATERTGPLAPTLHQHLLGHGEYPGLTRFTQGHFWSESSIPLPVAVSPQLSAAEAAAAVVGETPGLDATELDGAELSPWPAPSGYLRSSSGRGLAAFDTDDEGRIRLFLDRRVYRDQAAHLIPAGIEASASILDLVFPAFPEHTVDFDTGVIDLDLSSGPYQPVLTVLTEDASGARSELQRVSLRSGERNHIVDAFTAPLADDVQLILRIEGSSAPHNGVPQMTSALPLRPAKLAAPSPSPASTPATPRGDATTGTPAAAAPESPVPATVPSEAAPVEPRTGPSQSELISPYDKPKAAKPEADEAPAASPEPESDTPTVPKRGKPDDTPASDDATVSAPPASD